MEEEGKIGKVNIKKIIVSKKKKFFIETRIQNTIGKLIKYRWLDEQIF